MQEVKLNSGSLIDSCLETDVYVKKIRCMLMQISKSIFKISLLRLLTQRSLQQSKNISPTVNSRKVVA